MPRARNIKPGFFENEHLGVLNSDARLLFAALWTLADKQGVVECRIPRIRTYAFRYRNDITDADVNRELTVLTRLDNGDMLGKVNHEGVDYLLIHNFVKHASPHHTEKRGDYPDYAVLKLLINKDAQEITVNSRKHHGENPPESLILNPDLLTPEILSADQKSARPHSFILKVKAEDLSDDWLVKELSPPNVIEMWNEIIVGEENKKSHVYLTKDRRTKIQSRTKDSLPDGQHWLDYFQSIATDTFCMGEKGWKATIDWALKPASVIKMKEGGYSEKVR